jgi:hypothetical protein
MSVDLSVQLFTQIEELEVDSPFAKKELEQWMTLAVESKFFDEVLSFCTFLSSCISVHLSYSCLSHQSTKKAFLDIENKLHGKDKKEITENKKKLHMIVDEYFNSANLEGLSISLC